MATICKQDENQIDDGTTLKPCILGVPDTSFLVELSAQLSGDETLECNASAASRGLTGEVEAVAGSCVRGYVIDGANPRNPVDIKIFLDEKLWWEGPAKRLWTFEVDGQSFQVSAGFSVELPCPEPGVEHWRVEIVAFAKGCSAISVDLVVALADRYVGYIDSIVHCANGDLQIAGWAYDRAEPLAPVEVRVLQAGREIFRALAKDYREDLKAAGIGFGRHAFAITLSHDGMSTNDISVFIANSAVKCEVYPETLHEEQCSKNEGNIASIDITGFIPGSVAGFVDRFTDREISGWARSVVASERPIQVDLLLDGALYASTFTSIFRNDLQIKFNDHGFHGFHFELPPTYRGYRDHKLECVLRNINGQLENNRRTCPAVTKGVVYNPEADVTVATRLIYRTPQGLPQKENLPRCAFIVLNLNGAALLETFFSSFYRHNSYPGVEIIIIDHGSTDDSRQVCAIWGDRLDIRFVGRDRNYTFSQSNNYGASLTDANFLFLLNNDITFKQDIVGSALAKLQDPQIGILGVKLLDTPLGVPSFAPPLIQHLGVHYLPAPSDRSLHPFETRFQPHLVNVADASWKTPTVTGAFMVCRREDFESLGGFDEGYNYGYEDVDLCMGVVLKLGKEVVCANDLVAFHLRGYSRKKAGVWSGETMLANRRLLEQRYGRAAIRRQRVDLLTKPGYWSSSAPRIAFAVTVATNTTAAGDYFTAKELALELVKLTDAVIVYLEEGKSWYDLSGIDILIVMRHDYDLMKIKNAGPHLVKIGWARNWIDAWSEHDGVYDALWASSEKAALYLSSKCAMPVAFVPIATNPSVFAPSEPDEDLSSDYCFTGSFWGHPRDIIYRLEPEALPFRFAVYGHGWDSLPSFAPYHRGLLPYSRMKDVYASTRVVIDDANSVTKNWESVNSRVFDAIAAGALVITNGGEGARRLFGDLMPTYRTRQELEALLWRYLENEDERRALVEKLRQRVLEAHTYAHRARQVFDSLVKLGRDQLRIAIKIGTPNSRVRHSWGDYHFALGLQRALSRNGHRIRIDCLDSWYGRETLGDDIVIVLRGLSRYTPRKDQINLLWLISHPDEVASAEFDAYDHVFVASASYTDVIRKQTSSPVSTLLQCTDPELFHDAVPAPIKFEAVLFVGNSRNVFRRAVKDAADADLPLSVYGNGWRPFLSGDQIKNEYVENDRLASHYAHAGVVLNDHWDDMRDKGFISNRVFDCLASGARLVSDRVEGLEELFGDFVSIYDRSTDLPVIVDRLNNEPSTKRAERAVLAEQVRTDHSFDARSTEILKVIETIDAKKWNV